LSGEITPDILDRIGISNENILSDNIDEIIERSIEKIKKHNVPVALLIKEGDIT